MKKDSAAPDRVPGFLEAMKAKLVDSIPPGDWIYEVKFDGYRALAPRGGRPSEKVNRPLGE
jgi:bifunctional non-homologous end joining protein LigD